MGQKAIVEKISSEFPNWTFCKRNGSLMLLYKSFCPTVIGLLFKSSNRELAATRIYLIIFLAYKPIHFFPIRSGYGAFGLPFQGDEILQENNRALWDLSSKQDLDRLIHTLRVDVFPILESLTELDKYIEFQRIRNSGYDDINDLEEEGYALFLAGRYEEAVHRLELVSQVIDRFGRDDSVEWKSKLESRCKQISKLIREKKIEAVEEQLEAWRKFTLEQCKLEPFKSGLSKNQSSS